MTAAGLVLLSLTGVALVLCVVSSVLSSGAYRENYLSYPDPWFPVEAGSFLTACVLGLAGVVLVLAGRRRVAATGSRAPAPVG